MSSRTGSAWEPSWEPFAVDSPGRPWRLVESKPLRSGPHGLWWTATDTAWGSTDQKVGGSSPSGRATQKRPAGTGKTTALAPAVQHLHQHGRTVLVEVLPTAGAAEVLATETGMAADTLDKLLHEHRRPDRPPAPGYHLAPGATVILDEAGTVSTPKLDQLVKLAKEHRWRGRDGRRLPPVQCRGEGWDVRPPCRHLRWHRT